MQRHHDVKRARARLRRPTYDYVAGRGRKVIEIPVKRRVSQKRDGRLERGLEERRAVVRYTLTVERLVPALERLQRAVKMRSTQRAKDEPCSQQ